MAAFVKIVGMRELQKKLKGKPIYAGPWKEALSAAVVLVWRAARRRAPRDEGRLQASLTMDVDASPVPMWGRVGTDARPVAWVLEAGRRRPKGQGLQRGRQGAGEPTIDLHYRKGARKGKSTAKWLRSSLSKNRGRINKLFAQAAEKIEKVWAA